MTKEEGDFLANCRLGRIDECRSALENGINPNCVDTQGRGALDKVLHRRGDRQLPELVKLLLEFGADPAGWEPHPLVIRFAGSPVLCESAHALRDSLAPIIAELETRGMAFSFLKPNQIAQCLRLKLPPQLGDLYKFAFPLNCPSDIEFLDGTGIQVNTMGLPGSGLAEAGLIPIATNFSGDTYCVDGNHYQSFETSPVYHFGVGYYEVEYPEILKFADGRWSSFRDFLYHATEIDN